MVINHIVDDTPRLGHGGLGGLSVPGRGGRRRIDNIVVNVVTVVVVVVVEAVVNIVATAVRRTVCSSAARVGIEKHFIVLRENAVREVIFLLNDYLTRRMRIKSYAPELVLL